MVQTIKEEINFILASITADGTKRAISLRSERSMSRGFPSLELDTVIEERSDQEQTQVVMSKFV